MYIQSHIYTIQLLCLDFGVNASNSAQCIMVTADNGFPIWRKSDW